jgi:ketosteroid isomerase-like protein
MILKLPQVLGDYFAAANARDPDRVAACFTEGASVRDEGKNIQGRESIRAWAEESGRKYRYSADVRSIKQGDGGTVVVAHLTGDFPGSPIDLSYCFKLSGELISDLQIG